MATITGKKLTIDGYTFDLNNEQDYEVVTNKPKIEGTELNGDKSFSELGIEPIDLEDLLHILT